ncbi:MAG TPA: homoserine dehydrogenase [Ruminococcaceae bacterium]|nr:homoserine dehydrogenase [Oscillospiraceae bacterium]
MVNVAIMGHGTVGSGVAELIIKNSNHINREIKTELRLKHILDLRKFEGLSYSDRFTDDFNVILNDKEVDIVVETMGGLHPAYDFVKACLLAGKSVVTSNKELVAEKGVELIKIAEEKNVNFLFEASVGGGIPVIRPICQCLAANEISEIKGILNGTTNFILNKMVTENMDFSDALKIAQDKGYAEKDPTADIEGHDACRKICILAALAFGKHVYPEQVKCEGVTGVSLTDIEYANTLGYAIKLIGKAKKNSDGTVSVSVAPMLVSHEHLLSGVNGVFNAISVIGDAVDEVIFYGRGAGKMPTASAVVADVMDAAKHLKARKYISWEEGSDSYVAEKDEPTVLYVYIKTCDFKKTSADIENLFPNSLLIKNEHSGEIAFLTGREPESSLNEKIDKIFADNKKILHTI